MMDATGAPRRFSATEAAFTGLRLIRRDPGAVAVWGAVYLAFTFILGAGMVVTVGLYMTALMAQQRAGAAADPAASLALLSRLLPFEGLAMIAGLAFYALLFAAVNRAVLRPGTGGPGRLALGGDEGRQLLLFVILGVIFFVAYIAIVIVAVIIGVVAGVALAGSHAAAGAGAPAAMVAVVVLASLAVLGGLAFLVTRLSLASPLTFDTGRIDVFGSWRLTRGIFWPLFGAYLLAFLLMVILYVVALILFSIVAIAVGGGLGAAGVAFRPDMSSLGAYFGPMMILWLLMAVAVGTVALTMMLAVPAGAYAQLKAMGRSPLAPGAPPVAPVSDLPRFGN